MVNLSECNSQCQGDQEYYGQTRFHTFLRDELLPCVKTFDSALIGVWQDATPLPRIYEIWPQKTVAAACRIGGCTRRSLPVTIALTERLYHTPFFGGQTKN